MNENETISLAEATTDQLLNELFNRSTFAGVVVYSPNSHKFTGQAHEGFELRTTCDNPSTVYLMESAIAELQKNVEENGS
jgi:hypothetical protein